MINHRTDVLFVIAALASILVGSGYIALADNINKNNTGIYLPTNTNQKQVCKTSGENSPISGSGHGSCTARSSDTIAESGGDTMAATQEGAAKTTIPTPPPPPPPTTHPTIITLDVTHVTSFTVVFHIRLIDPIARSGVAGTITMSGSGFPSGFIGQTDASGSLAERKTFVEIGTFTVQAHFAGAPGFGPSDSGTQTFTVL